MSTYNPTIDRTTLLEGPAHIRYDATHYLWCEGPVALNLVRPVDDFNVPGISKADEVLDATCHFLSIRSGGWGDWLVKNLLKVFARQVEPLRHFLSAFFR